MNPKPVPSRGDGKATIPRKKLPRPNSVRLRTLLSDVHLQLYKLLYSRRSDPPSMQEIRQHMAEFSGLAPLQTDRRVRELRAFFDIDVVRTPVKGPVYLVRVKSDGTPPGRFRTGLSSRIQAAVFERDGARCAWCGRGPSDGIKLVIDHKTPVSWGGTNELSNLRVLCEEHNHGRQAHFAEYEPFKEAIVSAMRQPKVHRRLGDLFLALEGKEVPVDLIAMVASDKNRGDPTRRLRELRAKGWHIVNRKRKSADGVTHSFYVLVQRPASVRRGSRAIPPRPNV